MTQQLARRVATLLHEGQFDLKGDPYIEHPAWVAAHVPERLAPAAWLHDTIEDTPATAASLATLFPSEVVALVLRLTHPDHVSLLDYLGLIALDEDAATIKRVDVYHNKLRTAGTEWEDHYRRKYAVADEILGVWQP